MKFRAGFVSNSSTTSFLITAARRDQLKVRVTKTIDLDDGENVVDTLEELDERMKWTHGDVDFSSLDSYVAAKETIAAGGVVAFVTVTDNYGDEQADLLQGVDEEYRIARAEADLGILYLDE
jgi:hypothetical protein